MLPVKECPQYLSMRSLKTTPYKVHFLSLTSVISSSPEVKEEFVVGSRSFHLRSGTLKFPAPITLFEFNLLPKLTISSDYC